MPSSTGLSAAPGGDERGGGRGGVVGNEAGKHWQRGKDMRQWKSAAMAKRYMVGPARSLAPGLLGP